MNILLITCDQFRPDAIENNAPGQPLASPLADRIRTPNLAALAREGTRFTECHSPDPICVPARASITTGLYPHKATGHKVNAGAVDPAKHPCLAAHFAAHGFDTAAFGKLHYPPYTPPGEPDTLHGFQHAELYEEGRILALFDPKGEQRGLEAYHDWLADGPWAGYDRAHAVGNNDVHPAPSPMPAEFHESSWAVDRTLRWLEEREKKDGGEEGSKPFLIWTSLARPHCPFDPPRPYDTLYDPREMPPPAPDWETESGFFEGRDAELRGRATEYAWDKLSKEAIQVIRSHYAGLVTFQDECIGRLLDHLENAGLKEDTVVLFTADHGEMLGDMHAFHKACLYEPSVKVPLLLRVPGQSHQGETVPHLVGLHDVFPTLCSLADLPVPEGLDGTDLAPVAQDPAAAGRESIVAYCQDDPRQKIMIRRGSWKYIYCQEGPTEELYDLQSPEGELRNRASDPDQQERKHALREEIVAWCRANDDPGMLDGDDLATAPPLDLEALAFAADKPGWRKY